MLRILIAEDEAHNREALAETLKRLGHSPEVAMDGHEALEKVGRMSFDLIMSDVRMPRMDGLQFFEAVRKLYAEANQCPPFVFMTAYGRMEEAVKAMKHGAMNFLSKPVHRKDLVAVLREVELLIQARNTNARSAKRLSASSGQAVYQSRAFADVVGLIDKVAPSMASVLLVGESGTGKEVLARRLHEKSGRGQGPFIAFHAGAMPETLLESELFGHERGAFTGAEQSRLGQIRSAHGGTFFLDEIGTMPLGTQAKLLRVLQDKTVTPLGGTAPISCDVRWVAATNVDLESMAEKGKFREDLLYRLRVVVVHLPALRDRPEDVGLLAKTFLEEFAQEQGREPLALSLETQVLLENYAWPGNVRELRNVIERAMALSDGTELGPDLLPRHIAKSDRAREIRFAVGTSLQSVEDRVIEETLRSCGGDKAQAALILGVAERTIYRWIKEKQN